MRSYVSTWSLFVLCFVALSAKAQEKTVQITITTDPPGASVFIDGQTKAAGVTPLTLYLKPDFYLVDIKLEGYQKQFDILKVEEKETFHYSLLAPLFGTLSIVSNVVDADVFVDGDPVGKKNPISQRVPIGVHSIFIKGKGFQGYSRQVTISADKETKVLATLQAEKIEPVEQWVATKATVPIYLANQGVCCSQAIRQSHKNLLGIWGSPKGDFLLAVGEGGSIERSSTQGALWNSVTSGTTQDLAGIWGLGSSIFAVGQNGTILHSSDGGATWTLQQSNTTQYLYSVWGSSLNGVYVVGAGGTVLFSSDLGKTWVPQESNSFEDLFGVFGRSASEVYAVGEQGKILRLKSGTWTALASDTKKDLYAVSASSGSLLAVGKDGAILRSTDGESWYQQKNDLASAFYGISRSSSGTFYAAGDVLLRSEDDGLSWSKISSEISTCSIWASSGGLILLGC
jgi:photosystem II stability/assembly factor-like uncharacterized protein